ncbi:MAG: citrate (Si)-synthase, partial [Methylotetracoccus sp.]|nr:citrate (Si)-synthase [Methylotetracoccus sp.]
MTSKDTITVTDNRSGAAAEFPIIEGTLGPPAIDITGLNSKLGYLSYDPGFVSTASCKSAITFIDGEAGILLYRGYPIEQLAERSTFLEVAYLLMNGELPTRPELEKFNAEVARHAMIHEALRVFFNGFHYDAHPMAMMVGVVGSLSAFYHG